MKIISYLIWSSTLLFSIHCQAQEIPAWLLGEWEGIGIQTNTNTSWLTLMTFEPGSNTPLLSYPDLDCRGHWAFKEITEDGTLCFQERITENSGLCSNGDYIWVSYRKPDQLYVEFAHRWAPRNIIASLTLNRRLKP